MSMKLSSVTLVTGNKGKALEFSSLLGIPVNALKLPLPEIQGLSVEDVVGPKAAAAFSALGSPVFVDDSGIVFEAWGGLPGALTSWFMDTVGNDGLLRMLVGWGNRRASVMTALGYSDGAEPVVVVGRVSGTIASEPRGSNGFGYDAIFIPDGSERTFAEMTDVEKNSVSMRSIAAQKLLDVLSADRITP